MHPGQPQPRPFPPHPGPPRSPGWARKRVLIPALFLTWFFGFALGTTGAAGSAPDDGRRTSATPRPTATATVTETATPEAGPAPTVTETKKVKVRTTVTVTAKAPAAGDPGPGDSGSVHYGNCSEARSAGAAPVHRGEPGYGRHLDRDGDGVGCDI
ncbi:hypothetical protein DB35_19020 [Streptomyces abyssalis]|uniref:Excalibur calcium-binding domain-containing protein n=1 Tax=Streptomyces abyssalis TaxID=933944 RepID=A0A1E7JL76_9ACTN|nr:excalibur calcium-binding domain-containing protein [Streptomyces abyssalis]OEU88401.1 hypothetical protein AN215_20165 [Streptomyces abyssalis]OEU89138.1 hypothetical protein DB35_19020 [Streptomyces abyssalis]OEV29944.1 hypothetical protein AN219_13715 [Streptomyces nanshensis]